MSASLGPKLSFSTYRVQDIDYSALKKKLTAFQIEKLTFFFTKFFDVKGHGVLEKKSFAELNEKLRSIAGWEVDSDEFKRLVDNSNVFWECLLDQVRVEHSQFCEGLELRTWEEALKPKKLQIDTVDLNGWLNMWAKLFDGAAGMDDFPIWVQLLPNILFDVQGGNKNGYIKKESLHEFYANFSKAQDSDLDKLTEAGYNTMTSNGEYQLDLNNYKLLFANFLLGRTIYGPGKFVFGCFDNSDLQKPYQIIYEE
uniref:Sarcoplasmic calcium-binding proteins I, III, and IV n=1 Tax=Acartia pacifica TaxID=335913 RepID=A0A0U2T6M5_ACAPC|nr:hypothetical protein [Acartia pacifica]